jgi:hypothetical protein
MEDGLLDHENLAAELGLADGESLHSFGPALDEEISDLERIGPGGGGSAVGFAEELAELDVPSEGNGSSGESS